MSIFFVLVIATGLMFSNTEGPFEVATKFFWDCTTTAKETRTNMRRALKNCNFFSAPGYVRASTL